MGDVDEVPQPPADLAEDRWVGFEPGDLGGGARHEIVHRVPMAVEQEEMLLGTMLHYPRCIPTVVDAGVQRADFESPQRGIVFAAILTVVDEHGSVDELAVIDYLRSQMVPAPSGRRGENVVALAAVGGPAYVLQLTERRAVPAMVKVHAGAVRELAMRRRMLLAGEAMAAAAADGAVPTDTALAAAERELFEVAAQASKKHQHGDGFGAGDSLERWAARYAEAQEDPEAYERRTLSWGSPERDQRLGRAEPGDVFVWSGWTKHAKTWDVLSMAEAFFEQGARGLILSGEMNDLSITDRFIAMGGHNHDAVREQRVPWSVLQPRLERVRSWQGKHVEQGKLTVGRYRALVQRARLAGKPFRFVVLDHLGLVRPERGQRVTSRREFVEDAVAEMKALAEEYEHTLLLVSQLSRCPPTPGAHPEYKRIPVSTDLKEASGIEQIATTVVFVHRHMSTDDGRQLQDRSGVLTFPFHRHKAQPRPLPVTFQVPGEEPGSAYRYVPKVLTGEVETASTENGMVPVASNQARQTSLDVVPVDDDPFAGIF